MPNTSYAALTRQTGLRQEIRVIANNIANVSTNGFQKKGVVFSEFVSQGESPEASLSMATAEAWMVDRSQGQMKQTGGSFDFAIDGDGYFPIETPDGVQLTRAGAFQPGPDGDLVTPDGYRLLDAGGAPVFVPPDAKTFRMSDDGTLAADDQILTQIGVLLPNDVNDLIRVGNTRYQTEGGTQPVEDVKIRQGFLEASNVDAVVEVSRMIEVQRAYEQGRNLLTSEHDRLKSLIETLGK